MRQFLLCCACILSISCGAQPFATAFSESFPELDGAHMRIYRAGNGNTVVFQTAKAAPMRVQVYDAAHKRIADEAVGDSRFDFTDRELQYDRIISAANDIVYVKTAFIDKKYLAVYRLVFSAETGKLVREDRLFDMPPIEYNKRGQSPTTPEGMPSSQELLTSSDPVSGHYAIAMNDPFASAPSKQIELHLYDAGHNELSHHYLDGLGSRYQQHALLQVIVSGSSAYVASYSFNPKNAGGPPALALSRYTKEGFELHELPLRNLQARPRLLMQLNPKSGLLEALLTVRVGETGQNMMATSKTFYSVAHVYVNTADFSIVSVKPLESGRLSSYARTHYKAKGEFAGIPDALRLNADGSSTVVLTERTHVSGGYGGDRERLGDVGLLTYDEKGNFRSAFVIPREHNTIHESGLYDVASIGSPKGQFLVMNDHPRNLKQSEIRAGGILTGTEDAQAACFALNGKAVTRSYFLGAPDEGFDNRYINFTVSAFAPDNSECVFLVHEKSGRRDRACRIAWVSMK